MALGEQFDSPDQGRFNPERISKKILIVLFVAL